VSSASQDTPEIRIDEPLKDEFSEVKVELEVKDELTEVKDESEDGYASDSTSDSATSELDYVDDTELDTSSPPPTSRLHGIYASPQQVRVHPLWRVSAGGQDGHRKMLCLDMRF